MPRVSPYVFPGIKLKYLPDELLFELGITKPETLPADVVIRVVAKMLKLKAEDIIGRSRKRELCEARCIAMYQLRHVNNLSLQSVGNLFDGRDHTTVIHDIRMYLADVEAVASFRVKAELIAKALDTNLKEWKRRIT